MAVWVVDGVEIDLFKVPISQFRRELDMKEGVLRRTCEIELEGNRILKICTERFYSLSDKDLAYQHYKISPVNFDGKIELRPYLDFNIRNSDSNYDEDFWENRDQACQDSQGWVKSTTKKTAFTVCAAMQCELFDASGNLIEGHGRSREGHACVRYSSPVSKGRHLSLYRRVAITSTFYASEDQVLPKAKQKAYGQVESTFQDAVRSQIDAWGAIWSNSDICIEGDVKAQQGIRFNIFQLNQTYSGDDPRLNIGPKGFTGEKYGGSTYWDTEAYCIPFYLSTAPQEVARNLLIYRYHHLDKAIENAALLGFTDGAALYPMVTMNGEECHNEWEITFEEIHRNGAMVYAIYDYIRYTGDNAYLSDYGLEVLIGIARFWAQRVHLSPVKNQYVMHGVTGPNEYENNVNNNWYTNYLAAWCLRYAVQAAHEVKSSWPGKFEEISKKTGLNEEIEFSRWVKVAENMYLPEDQDRGIFLQQEGYLDKEDKTVKDLTADDRPLNQRWSWDRILRSPFIKQADVLQGIYFFEEDFSQEEIKRNFDYYESRTVHESSLSPCVHSILAATLGLEEKAYEMYLRTARLDLDDYNNDTEDGCHITSMAGTWMAIVKGFGGMRIEEDTLVLNPFIPDAWKRYSFHLIFRGIHLTVTITKKDLQISSREKEVVMVKINDQLHKVSHEYPLKLSYVN
jgi:maltose phosphorylase